MRTTGTRLRTLKAIHTIFRALSHVSAYDAYPVSVSGGGLDVQTYKRRKEKNRLKMKSDVCVQISLSLSMASQSDPNRPKKKGGQTCPRPRPLMGRCHVTG